MTIITFTLIYVCIAIIWAGIVKALLDSRMGNQPKIKAVLEEHKITRSTASIINGAVWPYSIPMFLYGTIKGLVRHFK